MPYGSLAAFVRRVSTPTPPHKGRRELGLSPGPASPLRCWRIASRLRAPLAALASGSSPGHASLRSRARSASLALHRHGGNHAAPCAGAPVAASAVPRRRHGSCPQSRPRWPAACPAPPGRVHNPVPGGVGVLGLLASLRPLAAPLGWRSAGSAPSSHASLIRGRPPARSRYRFYLAGGLRAGLRGHSAALRVRPAQIPSHASLSPTTTPSNGLGVGLRGSAGAIAACPPPLSRGYTPAPPPRLRCATRAGRSLTALAALPRWLFLACSLVKPSFGRSPPGNPAVIPLGAAFVNPSLRSGFTGDAPRPIAVRRAPAAQAFYFRSAPAGSRCSPRTPVRAGTHAASLPLSPHPATIRASDCLCRKSQPWKEPWKEPWKDGGRRGHSAALRTHRAHQHQYTQRGHSAALRVHPAKENSLRSQSAGSALRWRSGLQAPARSGRGRPPLHFFRFFRFFHTRGQAWTLRCAPCPPRASGRFP